LIQLGSMSYSYDHTNNLDEDDFLSEFGLPDIKNSRQKAIRNAFLKQHEKIIRKQNKQYNNGMKTWWDKLNYFSDLPDHLRNKQKTGLKKPRKEGYGRGLIPYNETEERSEKYFDQYRYSRASVPRSYSSVDERYVTPVRDQKQCGSCVAFATIAAIEVCFKKLTGVEGDYSEQELVDCGYRKNYANGCRGAQCYSYTKWIVDNKRELMHENDHLYMNLKPKLRCPREKPYRQGARVSDQFHTPEGNEKMMKKLVYEHGAVIAAVNADNAFSYYGGGILTRCYDNSMRSVTHAVTVVGYGREGGQNFWLIKNSWGKGWGVNGYIKLKRGVNACGIGWDITTVTCERVRGPTDGPQTTKEPCFDNQYTDCKKHAKTNCKKYGRRCRKSCGLCKGMTPHESNTCPDVWATCSTYWRNYCDRPGVKTNCCMSCKKNPGCSDIWESGCVERRDEFCPDKYYRKMCKKTCGLC